VHDVENCDIRGIERLVGAVGVRDLVIVDTSAPFLVADKASGHEVHQLHRAVHRPWGDYTALDEGDRYKIRRIGGLPGTSLSLQMHHHRSDHGIVVQSMAKVVNDSVTDDVMAAVTAGQSRPLEPMYPVVLFVARRVKTREEALERNKAASLTLDVLPEGTREVPGRWLESTEGATLWLRVFNALTTGGAGEIRIALTDGLKGSGDAPGSFRGWQKRRRQAHTPCAGHAH